MENNQTDLSDSVERAHDKSDDDENEKEEQKAPPKQLGQEALLARAVQQKSKEKSLAELFRRSDEVARQENRDDQGAEEEAEARKKSDETASTETTNGSIPSLETTTIEPETRAVELTEPGWETKVIPLDHAEEDEHVIELDNPPVDAVELHERVQPGRDEVEDIEKEPPEPEPELAPEVTPPNPNETVGQAANQAEAPPTAEVMGAGGGEMPPGGQDESAAPEPEMPPVPPDWRPPELLGSASVDPRSVEPGVTHEVHTVHEQRGGGGGLALLVGAIDYFRGRRLRRAQRKLEKRTKAIEQAQAEARDVQYRNTIEQAQQNRQLQESIAAEAARREQLAHEHQEAFERLAPTERSAASTSPTQTEKAPAAPVLQETIEEQAPELPAGHHLERSAWHTIEVDKSGRAVEAPVFEYGDEFKREQHPEARRQAELPAAALAGYSALTPSLNGTSATPPPGQLSTNSILSTPSTPPLTELPPTSTSDFRSSATDPVNFVLWAVLGVIVLTIIIVLTVR